MTQSLDRSSVGPGPAADVIVANRETERIRARRTMPRPPAEILAEWRSLARAFDAVPPDGPGSRLLTARIEDIRAEYAAAMALGPDS